MSSLSCQEMELECIRTLGEEILSSCHADSVITIKSWISVTKTRFEEVSTEEKHLLLCEIDAIIASTVLSYRSDN